METTIVIFFHFAILCRIRLDIKSLSVFPISINYFGNSVKTEESRKIHKKFVKSNHDRPVVPGGAGGAMAPPNFGKLVNPISTKGGSLCPLNNTGTPGFSDLPTALSVKKSLGKFKDFLKHLIYLQSCLKRQYLFVILLFPGLRHLF